MNNVLCWYGVVTLCLSTGAAAQQKWEVHEWGTFTSLQDESGAAIGGINTDDEPVPPFVHRLADFLLLRPTEVPPIFFQGAPSCHPDATMRLETPVVYFHPPSAETNIQSSRLEVRFRGGWLTEYYPDATAEAPGIRAGTSQFPHLNSDTEGKLVWEHLQIGGDWPLTNTSAHVWISPRAVQAALVRGSGGESEKFLFYRGVAHLDAPLRVSRDLNTGELQFHSQVRELPAGKALAVHSIWLVDIQNDGRIAFRVLPSLVLDRNPEANLAHTPAAFSTNDFGTGNLEKLKAALKAALISEGLFSDEAQALLNTWELSYFKSAGLRVFFIVPRAWTDYYLPLTLSLPAEIRRVMVGRIELVTSEERNKLRELARLDPGTIRYEAAQLGTNFYGSLPQMNQELAQVNAGQISLSRFVAIPKSYQTYLDLGRFRNALVLEEARSRPTEGLTNFIAAYRLEAYQPVETPPGD